MKQLSSLLIILMLVTACKPRPQANSLMSAQETQYYVEIQDAHELDSCIDATPNAAAAELIQSWGTNIAGTMTSEEAQQTKRIIQTTQTCLTTAMALYQKEKGTFNRDSEFGHSVSKGLLYKQIFTDYQGHKLTRKGVRTRRDLLPQLFNQIDSIQRLQSSLSDYDQSLDVTKAQANYATARYLSYDPASETMKNQIKQLQDKTEQLEMENAGTSGALHDLQMKTGNSY